MNLDNYVYVTGEGGLFDLIATRGNGLVLKHLVTEKSNFYSTRKHQFTPLGTVAIYTLEDSEPLKNIFETMISKLGTTDPVDVKSEKHIIQEYFETILPNYDEDKVSLKDMKKVIKWFKLLHEKGLLESTPEEDDKKSGEEE